MLKIVLPGLMIPALTFFAIVAATAGKTMTLIAFLAGLCIVAYCFLKAIIRKNKKQ